MMSDSRTGTSMCSRSGRLRMVTCLLLSVDALNYLLLLSKRRSFLHISDRALKVAVIQAPVFLLKEPTQRELHRQLDMTQCRRL